MKVLRICLGKYGDTETYTTRERDPMGRGERVGRYEKLGE